MGLKFSIDIEEFRKKLKQEETNIIYRAERLAMVIAEEVVNHARSLTSHKQPPAKSGEGRRPAHPGKWADITSNLANSIKGRVLRDGFKVTAVVEATMEYAEALDAKEGYEVLGGAEELARKAIRKHGRKVLFGD